jgi:D-serine deaminase-like pyridoxal phosphate-dependent protein
VPVTFDELETPFLTVDLDAVERNIRAMQHYCDEHAIALRPHVKTHKLPLVAELQLQAGAVGLTCQKLGEAEMLVEHGCGDDILITFPLIGGRKGERFAELAARTRAAVAADSAVVAGFLSAALQARGASAEFLVDCDTGYGRTGVQTPGEAADLAEVVDALPGLAFRGLMTHPTRPESGPWLRAARTLIEERGLEVRCVSGGGTPAALRTHEIGGITELRAGTYVYGDRRSLTAGMLPLERCALRVRATVVSTPTPARAILDAGSKALTSDLGLDVHGTTYGEIVEYPDAVVYALSEEHAHVDVARSPRPPEIGETVTIVPNHACGTVNLHAELALHRSGRDVDIVPVVGRGCSR